MLKVEQEAHAKTRDELKIAQKQLNQYRSKARALEKEKSRLLREQEKMLAAQRKVAEENAVRREKDLVLAKAAVDVQKARTLEAEAQIRDLQKRLDARDAELEALRA